ncbi:uncharacterized protein F21D5.5 isoform X2 [Odontomachus brunneus]|uniref:uncharacterized protein F21D5.5 isoform X2 n=1 Tax=Odontomachus brunneus TaxID=486640 RepID=UPI0013F18B54|nr:uncharacterized protein F21D5.5 isoform X2 [Odontomachus brunneus]
MSATNTVFKSCYILSIDKSSPNIFLPDNEPIFVGRSPETGVTDTKCSRQQVRLCANYTEAIITVQQVGQHPCGFNGFRTQKDVRFVARHSDHLELLYGKYAYEFEFNPPPLTRSFISRKRFYDLQTSETENKAKMLKLGNYSDEELECNRDEEKLSSSNIHLDQKTLHTECSISSEENNSNSNMPAKWESIDNGKLMIYTASSVQNQSKVAAYDMDGTLIKTKSGLVFPKDCNDWQLLYPDVPGKLKQFHANGYKIVIFTNQAGLRTGKVKISDFKIKIERIVHKIGIPIQVFIAVGISIYRKPAIGMWEILEKENGGTAIDKANSFYVGDAAGRPKNWAVGKKKDHSTVDRLMALNLNVKFETPEEHFLKHKVAPYVLPEFNPKNLPKDCNVCKPADANLTPKQQEIILMVGSPGSGKSHFAKHYLKEYEYVNRDTLGSWQKCTSMVDQYLNKGKSVVIDNTNPDPASRKRYTEVAKKYKIPVRCFVMTTNIAHAKHNNKFRELTDPNHIAVNEIIINSYMKNYVTPSLEEGYKEIVEINFVPKFLNEQDQRLYEMYLLES